MVKERTVENNERRYIIQGQNLDKYEFKGTSRITQYYYKD